jgi:hypothetical protein
MVILFHISVGFHHGMSEVAWDEILFPEGIFRNKRDTSPDADPKSLLTGASIPNRHFLNSTESIGQVDSCHQFPGSVLSEFAHSLILYLLPPVDNNSCPTPSRSSGVPRNVSCYFNNIESP